MWNCRNSQPFAFSRVCAKWSIPGEKFVALDALHDRNESLYFLVLVKSIDAMQPLILCRRRHAALPQSESAR